jgi:hypothetical protein
MVWGVEENKDTKYFSKLPKVINYLASCKESITRNQLKALLFYQFTGNCNLILIIFKSFKMIKI